VGVWEWRHRKSGDGGDVCKGWGVTWVREGGQGNKGRLGRKGGKGKGNEGKRGGLQKRKGGSGKGLRVGNEEGKQGKRAGYGNGKRGMGEGLWVIGLGKGSSQDWCLQEWETGSDFFFF
jgi:hypothetical protein